MYKNDAYLEQIHKDNLDILLQIKNKNQFFCRKYKSDFDFDTIDETFIFEPEDRRPTIKILIQKSKLEEIKIEVCYKIMLFEKNSRAITNQELNVCSEVSTNNISKTSLERFVKIDTKQVEKMYKNYDFCAIIKETNR